MKTPTRKRYTFLASVLLVVGGVVLASFLWIKKEQQHAINRALIDSLAQGNFKRSLKLVEDGADPNTRVIPVPTPTWRDLLDQLLHNSIPPPNHSPTAFMAVCGDISVSATASDYSRSLCIPEASMTDPQLMPLAQSMLIHGANISIRDETGATALMWASHNGFTNRISLLLEHGGGIDLQDNYGDTALHYAAMLGKTEAVKLLLKYHANPNARNKNNNTPRYIALQFNRSFEIVRLLTQAGATE